MNQSAGDKEVKVSYTHRESALIHGGNTVDPLTGAVNIPIYQTSTFQQKALGTEPQWEYARTGNPTRAALERLIAEMISSQIPWI